MNHLNVEKLNTKNRTAAVNLYERLGFRIYIAWFTIDLRQV